VTTQGPMQVTSCCNLLVTICQLYFNSQSAQISFLQLQQVFTVKHCLESHPYLTFQNELGETFSNSPMPNKLIKFHLVNHFCNTQILHCIASNIRKRVNTSIAEHGDLIYHCFFSDFNVIYFLINRTSVRNGLPDFSNTLYNLCSVLLQIKT
jgi:hypothetical protein